MRLLLRLSLLLLTLSALGGLGLFFSWRGSGRPQRDGTAPLAGLAAPVEVRFDAWGVPHLRAESLRDACAALGWLHANDRMGHLELGRRAVAGRLSELLGERTLGTDVTLLHLRLREAAESYEEVLGDEARELLEAYAEGVNAWLDERDGDLPPDLELIGAEPEPWTPVDSLGFALLMSRDLSYVADREERRWRMLVQLGAERTRELIDDPGLVLSEAQLKRAAAARAAVEPDLTPPGPGEVDANGSNNWAVGSSRSATGHPLVANDPHLNLRLPGVWYQVRIDCPGYDVQGMTLPGLPMVVIGQNRDVAWSFTNVELDNNDLFLEELDPQGVSVRRGARWVPIEAEMHAIRTGDETVLVELQRTDVGPLLEADTHMGLPARSLAWTAYTPFDPITPFLRLGRTTSALEVPAAIADFVCPVQNLVAGSRDGALVHTVLGRVPERGAGDGHLPQLASDEAAHWRGLLPHERNPLVVAPVEDLLVTANADIRPPRDDPAFDPAFVADFAVPHRVQRIRQVLLGRDEWDVEELAALQGEVVSLYALEVVERAAAALPEPVDPDAHRALEVLGAWDGTMGLEGVAALYLLFEGGLTTALFMDDTDGADLGELGYPERDHALLNALAGRLDATWIDDRTTEEVETLPDLLNRELASAWRYGVERWGADVERWDHGSIHRWTLGHPLAAAPLVGTLFTRGPYPRPGSSTTIGVATGFWGVDGIDVRHGASMRWVADTADPDRSRAVLPGGQSGHAFDAHYDDQLPLYLEARSHPVAFTREAVERATESTLRLVPASR